ncbi:hypothetical protein DFH09DRAFT_1070652 [Mycena vulgaris]|nr:hypothetical protein DFH09DRAFT_1070652 [Mycena vulgaris]
MFFDSARMPGLLLGALHAPCGEAAHCARTNYNGFTPVCQVHGACARWRRRHGVVEESCHGRGVRLAMTRCTMWTRLVRSLRGTTRYYRATNPNPRPLQSTTRHYRARAHYTALQSGTTGHYTVGGSYYTALRSAAERVPPTTPLQRYVALP